MSDGFRIVRMLESFSVLFLKLCVNSLLELVLCKRNLRINQRTR
jgi:hypothetical protein